MIPLTYTERSKSCGGAARHLQRMCPSPRLAAVENHRHLISTLLGPVLQLVGQYAFSETRNTGIKHHAEAPRSCGHTTVHCVRSTGKKRRLLAA